MILENEKIIDRLYREQASCVIRSGSETRIFHERGIRDLYALLTSQQEFLNGAFVADKVVGKGAAALMILGGVREVFAGVVSTPALKLLHEAGVAVEYRIEVPHIINRSKTDWCPVEKLCRECETAAECLSPIRDFIEKQQINQTFK